MIPPPTPGSRQTPGFPRPSTPAPKASTPDGKTQGFGSQRGELGETCQRIIARSVSPRVNLGAETAHTTPSLLPPSTDAAATQVHC
jgi:hypothetical protein